MKKFRLTLALASLLVLLFCGTNSFAQSSDYSGTADLNVKQLVQIGDLDLVSKDEAIIRLAEFKNLVVDEVSIDEEPSIAINIKYAYLGALSNKMGTSTNSTAVVVEESISDLLRVANLYKDVDSATLSSVFNEIVAVLEE